MANTYTPVVASGSTRGKLIKIAATTSPGTTLHAPSTTTTDFDYISIWAVNRDVSNITLTLQWGGTTASDDHIPYIIQPGLPPICLVDRWDLRGNATPDTVAAFASSANLILCKVVVYRAGTA